MFGLQLCKNHELRVNDSKFTILKMYLSYLDFDNPFKFKVDSYSTLGRTCTLLKNTKKV